MFAADYIGARRRCERVPELSKRLKTTGSDARGLAVRHGLQFGVCRVDHLRPIAQIPLPEQAHRGVPRRVGSID
jgi:hypothetical protein